MREGKRMVIQNQATTHSKWLALQARSPFLPPSLPPSLPPYLGRAIQVDATGEAKIANLEVTVGVDQEVGRLGVRERVREGGREGSTN